jgi:hypothetical protein
MERRHRAAPARRIMSRIKSSNRFWVVVTVHPMP